MDIPNIEELPIQKEEVDSLCWLSVEEIRTLMKEGKYFGNHYDEFEILQKWLKEKDKNMAER